MRRHCPRISEVYHNLTHTAETPAHIAHSLCELLALRFRGGNSDMLSPIKLCLLRNTVQRYTFSIEFHYLFAKNNKNDLVFTALTFFFCQHVSLFSCLTFGSIFVVDFKINIILPPCGHHHISATPIWSR